MTVSISDSYELQGSAEWNCFSSSSDRIYRMVWRRILFAIRYEENGERRALEFAADKMGVEKKMEFHRALGDAYYTACILQKIEDEYIFPILLWMYIRILKAGVKRYMCPIQPMINMCQGNFTPGKKP